MTQNYSKNIYNCCLCNYVSNRKYNLNRHHISKHNNKNIENIDTLKNEKKVSPNEKKVSPNEKKVSPCEKKVSPCENIDNICIKCNKFYKTKKSLLEHEKKCKGIDELTCPRCMTNFTTKQAKSKHIKRNNCKPRSIIYAKTPNSENIERQNINTFNNIENQTNNYITNYNNIYINNYGNERQDYLSFDKMLEIFKKVYDIPRLLTEEIHFNKEFPENNNIQYKNDSNALIKKDDEFILKDLNILAEELVKEKTVQMQKFALENKNNICTNIETQKYQDIVDLLLHFILLKEPQEHYKKQIKNIRDLIKNNN